MKITTIPQLYRNFNRSSEIASVLSKYGLADWVIANSARIEAARGRVDSCREHATPALATGSRIGMTLLEAWSASALGLLELGQGDARRALEHLRVVWSDFQEAECRDPGPLWWQGDLVEALVATGARTDAERLRYGVRCFAYFVAALIGLGWLMKLGHG